MAQVAPVGAMSSDSGAGVGGGVSASGSVGVGGGGSVNGGALSTTRSGTPRTEVSEVASIPRPGEAWGESGTKYDDPDVNTWLASGAVPRPPNDEAEEAYVPLVVVKAKIAKIVQDMADMKEHNIAVIEEMEKRYRDIHAATQAHYKAAIADLKAKYRSRALADKQVIASLEREAREYKERAEEAVDGLKLKIVEMKKRNADLTSAAKGDLDTVLAEKDDTIAGLTEEIERERSAREAAEAAAAAEKERADTLEREGVVVGSGLGAGPSSGSVAALVLSPKEQERERQAANRRDSSESSDGAQSDERASEVGDDTADNRSSSSVAEAPRARSASPPPPYTDQSAMNALKEEYEGQIAELRDTVASLELERDNLAARLDAATASLESTKQSLERVTKAYEESLLKAAERHQHASQATSSEEDIAVAEARVAAAEEEVEAATSGRQEAKDEISAWGKAFVKENGHKPTTEDKKAVKPKYKALEAADKRLTAANVELEEAQAALARLKGGGGAGGSGSGGSGGGGGGDGNSDELENQLARLQLELLSANKKIADLEESKRSAVLDREAELNAKHAEELRALREGGAGGAGGSATATTTVSSGEGGSVSDEEVARLRARVQELESRPPAPAAAAETTTTGGSDGGVDSEEAERLREELASATAAKDDAQASVDRLQAELEAAQAAANSAAGAEGERVAALTSELADTKAELEQTKKAAADAAAARDAAANDGEAAATEANARADAAEAQVAQLTERVEQLESELASAGDGAAATAASLAEKESALATAQERVAELESEVAALRETAEAAGSAAAQLEELAAEHAKMATDFETIQVSLKEEQRKRKQLHNKVEDMLGKIRVYARVRPLSRTELERGNESCVSFPDEFSIRIKRSSDGVEKEFLFDQVFDSASTQEAVFENASNLVQSALDGFNVCIFAYGQTGSGKTFTMAGEPGVEGIIPRSFEQIFMTFRDSVADFRYSLSVYMLEIYNRKLVDLLLPPDHRGKAPDLQIKRDSKGMVYVNNITLRKANQLEDLHAILEEGTSHRHTGSTKMNATSSRSHLVFSMLIEARNVHDGRTTTGKLSLVDLAGSEKVGKTEATGERLEEAKAINSSLSALGNVISKLAKGDSFIPYRDDKLTLLMMDSLGGNAKTLMFVNLSPADYNSEESINSLMYAERVKEIKNDASKNVDSAELRKLKRQVAMLKAKLAGEDVQMDEEEEDDGLGPAGPSGE